MNSLQTTQKPGTTRRFLGRVAAMVVATGLVVSGAVAATPQASASQWLTVRYATIIFRDPITTPWTPRDNPVTLLKPGEYGLFDCWTYGPYVYDGAPSDHGNNIWGRFSFGDRSRYVGYVPDWYINLGGATLKSLGFPMCDLGSTISATVVGPTIIFSGPTFTPRDNPAQLFYPGEMRSFNCWSYGPYVYNGSPSNHGNNIWDHFLGWGDRDGWVPDWYVSLGGRTLKSLGYPQC